MIPASLSVVDEFYRNATVNIQLTLIIILFFQQTTILIQKHSFFKLVVGQAGSFVDQNQSSVAKDPFWVSRGRMES